MTRKKRNRQATTTGVYALCITVGLILGLGLAPLMDNLPLMLVLGGAAGAAIAFLINRKSPGHPHRRHH